MKIESLVAALGSPQRKKRLYALIDLGMLGRKAKAAVPAIQSQCLQIITQLTKHTATAIRSELFRKFVHEGHGHLLRNDDHQDFEMTIHSAVIPALKDAKDAYFFLCGESDADIEHGFACLFKNDTQFCACAPELSRVNYRADDVEAFENIFRSHHVAFIRAG